MTSHSDNKTMSDESTPKNLDGYTNILSTPTIFAMDLVGKNLQMNGIDAVWFYPDPVEDLNEQPSLFVKTDQKDNALSILASLDLTDFTSLNDK